jgi:hypothetical protein
LIELNIATLIGESIAGFKISGVAYKLRTPEPCDESHEGFYEKYTGN